MSAISFQGGHGKHGGVVIVGGGMQYATNAYIAIRLLRHLGCNLSIEFWHGGSMEFDDNLDALFKLWGVRCRNVSSVPANDARLSLNGWAYKPFAIRHSEFRHVLFMDADNFAVRDPSYLFDDSEYKEKGAMFWPDVRKADPEALIWKEMGIPPTHEWEFESGQMVIDKEKCLEPLEMALQMNLDARKWYKLIWGDKDTFRFAWHHYGRPFAMTKTPVQLLGLAGAGCCGVPSGGVMCQHDLEGRRIFQHRNLYKWQLHGANPRIPGFMFEGECREFLDELRVVWDGRIGPQRRWRSGLAPTLSKELIETTWLVEGLGHSGGVFMTTTVPKDAEGFDPRGEKAQMVKRKAGGGSKRLAAIIPAHPSPMPVLVLPWPEPTTQPLAEWRFSSKGVVLGAEARKWVFWLGNHEGERASVTVHDHGKHSLTLHRQLTSAGSEWHGILREGQKRLKVRMRPLHAVYAAADRGVAFGPTSIVASLAGRKESSLRGGRAGRAPVLRLYNSAHGIGDHIHGLFAAVGHAQTGRRVIYHTRFAGWMTRVRQPGLTIEPCGLPGWGPVPAFGRPPAVILPGLKGPPQSPKLPANTYDLNYDEPAQRKYASGRSAWYAAAWGGLPVAPGRPAFVDQTRSGEKLFDFERYVLLTPLAAWKQRDWPDHHWIRLAHLLDEAGYHVVALGTPEQEERLHAIFDTTRTLWAVGLEPETVMEVMLGAAAVIGPDSGMIHVAGLLGVPGLCVHSHLPAEYLFAHAPSVRSVVPATSCTACRWLSPRGYTSACDTACSALSTVGPETVMAAFRNASVLPARPGGVLPANMARERTEGRALRVPESAPVSQPRLIPPKVWFTADSHTLYAKAQECVDTWRKVNPRWAVTLMDRDERFDFVRTVYGGEIWKIFQTMPLGVMEADFWRYLVVHHHGGIYADTDARCMEEIERWVGAEDGLVIGLEDNVHFENWAFAGKPGHPALSSVIELILKRARGGWRTEDEHMVHYHTSPGVFTDGVLAYLRTKRAGLLQLPGVHRSRRSADGLIRIYPQSMLLRGAVVHHFGSATWGQGYKSWTKERQAMRERTVVATS